MSKIRDAFKIHELRKRLLFTLLMLAVVRLGCQLPVPGVERDVLGNLFQSAGDSMNFFNAITGGSFETFSVFALNITPYITASIIIQLLTIAFPKLEEMQRDGEAGRKKIVQITRYTTIGLSLLESIAMGIGFGRSNYISGFSEHPFLTVVLFAACLTAGSTILMWIGERITTQGIGNGISIVLIINIISRLPQDIVSLWNQFVAGKPIPNMVLAIAIIVAIIVAIVVLVVLLQGAERRIPVQYSKKLQGAHSFGTQSSYIPIKVNTAGVIPVIFAQSIMQTPVIIATLLGKGQGTGIGYDILYSLSESHWFNPSNFKYTIGAVIYVLLNIAFAYFYTSITFNPLLVADNLKKSAGFIPGIRPGKPTSDYLSTVLNRIIFIGAIGLSVVALIPIALNGLLGTNISFGGTSIIIVVGVVIETLNQIDSQMMVRNYRGFLND